MNTKSRVRTIATTFVFAIIVLFANAEAARAQSTHYASVTNDASNRVYEIMRISRDSANWSQSGYEITVRNTYYNGGGIVKAFVGYGYQDSGTVTILDAAGQNQPKIFLGSEVVVSGTIKYVPVNIQVPAWQYFSVEVKFGTTETTSITAASQVHFTGTTTTTGATGVNHDGSVNFTGNVGIGTMTPGAKLDVSGTFRASGQNSAPTSGAGVEVSYGGGVGYIQSYNRNSGGGNLPLYISGSSIQLNPSNEGNVGIGTANPNYGKLQIEKTNSGQVVYAVSHSTTGTNYGVDGEATGSGAHTNVGGYFAALGATNNYALIVPPGAGNVGIGTTTPDPTYKLDVNGDVRVSGNLAAKYQDVAEWVPSATQLAAGTVVVLDPTKSNQVTSSSVSYDTRVAGVISAQPGITLGEKGDSKVLVATTGRVKIKVDASKSPIRIGDLLVTSDIPGVAMKSEAVNLGGVQIHRPGTLIGKALEPLDKGKGEILVLLSLQ